MIKETVAHLRHGVGVINEPLEISGKNLNLVVKSATPKPLNASFEGVVFSGAAAKENVDVGGDNVLYENSKNVSPKEGACSIQ